MDKIKIFIGLPNKVEEDVNHFIEKYKDSIYIKNIQLSESQENKGFGISILLYYSDNNKLSNILEEVQKTIDEQLVIDFAEYCGNINYYYVGDNIWKSSEMEKPMLTEELLDEFKQI